MSTRTTLVTVLTTALAAGCATGNGHLASEMRTVPTFTAVEADSAVEVWLTVDGETTNQTELEVNAESNVLNRVETTVAGDTLYVDVERVTTFRRIRVVGSTAELSAALADNAATLTVVGVSMDSFDAWADNAAYLDLEGEVAKLDVFADNAAYVSAADLEARDVTVDLNNAANVEICATGRVTGTVDNAAQLTVLCGGDLSGVTVRNAGSVNR